MTRPTLSPKDIQAFVQERFGDDLHAKRVLSLSNAVTGALHAASTSIHAIGHALAQARGLSSKHAIKQIDRFVGNDRIVVEDLFPRWVSFVAGGRSELLVTLDWTSFSVDGHVTLSANVVTRHGRATPLLWRTVRETELKGHRNEIEDEMIRTLVALLPNTTLTLLADRGFFDVKLFAMLDELNVRYVIRIASGIKVKPKGARRPRNINALTPEKGHARMLEDVALTAQEYPLAKLVMTAALDRRDAWLLASNIPNAAKAQLRALYARRFTTEESFRDIKDLRFGMGMSATRVSRPERRDRLLLLSALAIGLLTLLGAAGDSLGMERMLKANTSSKRAYSLFRQGCLYYGFIPTLREELLRPLVERFAELIAGQPFIVEVLSHL